MDLQAKLTKAVEQGHESEVEKLLQQGAKPNAELVGKATGEWYNPNIARALIEDGNFDINDRGQRLTMTGKNLNSYIENAAVRGDLALLAFLLQLPNANYATNELERVGDMVTKRYASIISMLNKAKDKVTEEDYYFDRD